MACIARDLLAWAGVSGSRREREEKRGGGFVWLRVKQVKTAGWLAKLTGEKGTDAREREAQLIHPIVFRHLPPWVIN